MIWDQTWDTACEATEAETWHPVSTRTLFTLSQEARMQECTARGEATQGHRTRPPHKVTAQGLRQLRSVSGTTSSQGAHTHTHSRMHWARPHKVTAQA